MSQAVMDCTTVSGCSSCSTIVTVLSQPNEDVYANVSVSVCSKEYPCQFTGKSAEQTVVSITVDGGGITVTFANTTLSQPKAFVNVRG